MILGRQHHLARGQLWIDVPHCWRHTTKSQAWPEAHQHASLRVREVVKVLMRKLLDLPKSGMERCDFLPDSGLDALMLGQLKKSEAQGVGCGVKSCRKNRFPDTLKIKPCMLPTFDTRPLLEIQS